MTKPERRDNWTPDPRLAGRWESYVQEGWRIAPSFLRSDTTVTDEHAMWALLCQAADTTARAFRSGFPLGYPGKSAMPDAPDDVTEWQLMMAYYRGEILEAPTTENRPPPPPASAITRAEHVLDVYHRVALRRFGDWKRMRKAVYLKATKCPEPKILAQTGFNRRRLQYARDEACRDMWDEVQRIMRVGVNA